MNARLEKLISELIRLNKRRDTYVAEPDDEGKRVYRFLNRRHGELTDKIAWLAAELGINDMQLWTCKGKIERSEQ